MPDPLIYSGFSIATGLSGWLIGGAIRLFTGGDCNHAFFVYWDRQWNTWITVGANANGVTTVPLSKFLQSRKIVHLYRLKVPGRTLWDGLKAHVNDLDTHYNFSGLFGMAGVEIAKRLTGRPGYNIFSRKADLFCSEWCAMVIKTTLSSYSLTRGVSFLPGYEVNQIDPFTLSQAEASSPYFESVDDPNNLRPPDNGL